MSRRERIKEEAKRAATAATWEKKINFLLARKKDPFKSEAEFCRKYNFDISVFNRAKKGATIPSEETLKEVEAAFHAEGV